ncbi:protein C18orf25 homolog isoform X1 [Xyrauchen texanus]|uniref:protein C18orf25 homolog isoform X1 n=1 Tax=Xyrauchen texanus TaxID=154827 RepID=UPI00224249D6|nr:protein C18orf25 homolog isoform X1 [Xyrauchen texanus]
MTDAQKANELPECPLEDGATAEEQEMPLRQETMPTGSPVGDEPISSQNPDKQPTPGLLSMPCLLKELHRDSDSGQPAETERPPITTQPYPQEDSDSSVCLRSPSSSGHLGDSDTLSSAEEVTAPTQNAGRKSRRSHSESDTSSVAMAAKKNRCQEKQVNGRVRVRGPRSQRQKLRMRQLRQKREAAARRKPDVLQDSSTSDSDITAHSSSSSPLTASSDNEGETINSHAPAGHRRAESSGASVLGLGQLNVGVASGSLGGVLEEALTRFAAMQRQTEERFRVWMERLTRLHSDDDLSSSENPEGRSHVSSFLPSSESQETLAAYQMARINANTVQPAHTAGLNGNVDSSEPNV